MAKLDNKQQAEELIKEIQKKQKEKADYERQRKLDEISKEHEKKLNLIKRTMKRLDTQNNKFLGQLTQFR